MAQGKLVITGVLQTIHILAMQGDIPIQMLAGGGCTAPVAVPAAFPWMSMLTFFHPWMGHMLFPASLPGCAWLLHHNPEQRLHF